jgi:hypothetical protein
VIKFVFCLCALSIPFLWAKRDAVSLMLSPAENEAIQQAKKENRSPVTKPMQDESEDLILTGIMYIAENQWTIWISNTAYNNTQRETLPFQLIDVQPGSIKISIKDNKTIKERTIQMGERIVLN